MRCKICGAKLKKEGDICANCYKEYQENEELKKDTNERLKLRRKYSISYEITKYIFLIIVFILAFIVSLAAGGILEALLVILIFAIVMGGLLFIDKRIAMATKATFYDTKVRYTFKFLFFNVDKTVKYSNIDDIRYFQTYRQKRFGYGDFCIYTKGVIPGSGFLNGFQIKNVENAEEVLKQISEIIGPIES